MSNPIAPPDNKEFTRILAPVGIFPAVCCDVVDRGLVETAYGSKHKKSIHFLIDENIPTGTWTHPQTDEVVDVHEKLAGKPFMVSAWFTATLNEKGNLRQFLRTWTGGRDLTRDEISSFDLDYVLGRFAALTIVHGQSEAGKWYANIGGCSQLPEGWTKVQIPADYVRIEGREKREGQPSETRPSSSTEPVPQDTTDYSDSDLAF